MKENNGEALRVQIPQPETFSLMINGQELPGFKRAAEWEGMAKLQKGQDYVIIAAVEPQPKEGYEIVKISPALHKRVTTPAAGKTKGAGKGSGGEGDQAQSRAAGAGGQQQ